MTHYLLFLFTLFIAVEDLASAAPKPPCEELLDESPTNEPTLEEMWDLRLLRQKLAQVISTLEPREQLVIKAYFGLRESTDYVYDRPTLVPDDNHAQDETLENIGSVLGLTKATVHQILRKAINKLKHPSRTQLLLPYIDR